MKQLLRLTERPFKMNDEGVYSLVKVRRGNNGVVSRGLYEGKKVLVKSQFKVETDDFIISKRQIVHQACGIVPPELDGSIVSNEYNVFQPTDECCIRYFDYLCYRPQMRHAFFLSCVGVHLEKMLFKTNDWLKRKFLFPSAEEQRKIADFLTAVDGRIGQLSQKKALLEDYKKGVMQQLFTQALRFKDDHGNDFPEWEEKTLGEVGAFKNGINKDKSDFGFGTPFVNLMDVFGKRVLNQANFGLINSTEKERSAYDLRAGDVLFIRSSVKRTGVGEAIIIEENIDAAVYSGFLIRFRQKGQRLTNGFMTYCFASPAFRKELLSYATTSANTNINQESLAEVALAIPSLPEQTKIANFLTALDRKIESVSSQITHTQTFKKGLLQQMFV